jgi:hypothetical protein
MLVFPFDHFRLREASLGCDVCAYVSGFTILIENLDVNLQRISATNGNMSLWGRGLKIFLWINQCDLNRERKPLQPWENSD